MSCCGVYGATRTVIISATPHRIIDWGMPLAMRIGIAVALLLAATLPALGRQQSGQQTAPRPAPRPEANPFPDETKDVPVLPSRESEGSLRPEPQPAADDSSVAGAALAAHLPAVDIDPVRSPDDPAPDFSGDSSGSSSSLQNVDDIIGNPDVGGPEKKPRRFGRERDKETEKEPSKAETAKSDVDVGTFYLDQKDWKGALSRFQSALVLDPENPDVYWGMAEAERNLGKFAEAKAHYETLLAYDPENKHAKQARKALKEPALAAAGPAAQNQTSPH